MPSQNSEIKSQVGPENILNILEDLPEGLFVIDNRFRIIYFNQRAEEITGFSRDEAIGRPCSEIFQTSICASSCFLKECIKAGSKTFGSEVQILTKDYQSVSILVQTSPLKDSQGNIVGGLETFHRLRPAEYMHEESSVPLDLAKRLGKDERMKKIFSILPDLAESEAPVLLQGESGVGKELIAATIHKLSRRHRYPMARVSCSAFSEEALVFELFGCRVNSLHNVKEDRTGRIEKANGGSLFLDEIDSLPQSLQIMLFRAFEDGQYEPLGAERPEPLDVRLIASTEIDLENRVREGMFKENLYYWLNVFQIQLPPLRERKEDILFLAHQNIQRLNRKGEKVINDIELDALQVLQMYSYPGNIKELENIIQHAHIIAKGKKTCLGDLPTRVVQEVGSKVVTPKMNGRTMGEVEKDVILEALRRNDWNRKKAAEELGINRTTLWRKMKRMGWDSAIRSASASLLLRKEK